MYPEGLICTGSNDKKINIYKPGESEPLEQLSGHLETGELQFNYHNHLKVT